MTDPRFASFDDFWPHYVREHSHPLSRTLHAVGTLSALGCLGLAAVTRRRALVPVALVLGYGPAWVGHFLIEGNRPATFQHPLWSLRGDFVMLSHMLRGTMAAEVERCKAMVKPSTDAPAASDTVSASDTAAPDAPPASPGPSNGHGDAPRTDGPGSPRILH